jgi:hypothetical protein
LPGAASRYPRALCQLRGAPLESAPIIRVAFDDFEGDPVTSKISVFAVLALVAVALLAPPLASANVLVNGDFENEPNWGASNGTGCGFGGDTGCSALIGSQLPGWTIEPGHAVTVHIAGTYPTISGTYSINMDGEGFNGHNANFYQDFATSSGQQYNLQYDWATWFNNTTPNLDVTVTDTVTSSVIYHGNFAWSAGSHHVNAFFSGTGNTLRLRIQEIPETGTNDNAYIVDNFVVVASGASATAPVPTLDRGLLALLACLLLAVGVVTVRARRR